MTIFDAPTRDFSEVRRQKTNTPLQALVMQNDVQVLEAARVMAQRMIAEDPESPDLVSDVFKRILIRRPRRKSCWLEGILPQCRGDIPGRYRGGRKIGCGRRVRTAAMWTAAKTAALMLTAQVIYNLDETITKE